MPRSIALVLSLLFLPSMAAAQSLTDALRLSTEMLPIGSRSLGMNSSNVSAVDGYSALDLNPAALAPLSMSEVSVSFWNRKHSSSATFFDQPQDASVSNTAFSSIGLAAPVPTVRGHLAVGLSYDRIRDYTSAYNFKAVNPNSSFLNTQEFIQQPNSSLTGKAYTDYLNDYNLAYMLGLTYNPDTTSGVLTTPFGGGLEQSGVVTEEGGLSALRLGAGIDIAEGVAAGATLNVFFGGYDYTRSYTETDVNNLFAGAADTLIPLSFRSATINDTRHQDQTGVSLKLGLLAYQSDLFRFGLTFETPTYMHVEDAFLRTGSATFKGGVTYTSDKAMGIESVINTYNIVTPLRATAGASVRFAGATIAGSLGYSDMSQIRFTNSDVDLSDLNLQAKSDLKSVISWHLGAEYILPIAGISLRAGYGVEPSPYKDDPATFNTKSWSAGAGVLLSKSILLEAGYRHSDFHTSHAVYNDLTVEGKDARSNVNDDIVKHDDVSLTFNYRF